MRKALGVMMVLFSSAAAVMGQSLAPGDQATTFTSSSDGSPQPFRLFVPSRAQQTTAPLPLVIVLHGWGVDQNAWFDRTPVKRVAEQYGYVVAAPHGRGNCWYRGRGERDVLDVVDEVKHLCRIDSDRVYLTGHSMGGWGTWWVAVRHPDVFAAISPMSGFPPGELLGNALHLAPFILHDSLDEIVPVTNSRAPAQELARLGISFQYREETGYGHSSRLIGDNLARVFEWFGQHTRVERPRRVRLTARTPAAGSAYWIRLLEPADYPKPASIDAHVDTSGALVVQAAGARSFAVRLDGLPTSASEPLPMQIGRACFHAEKKQGWAVFTAAAGDSWSYQLRSDEPKPTSPPVCAGKAAQVLRQSAGDQDRLAKAVAELLRQSAHADACVLDTGMFQLTPGELTLDKVLDLHTYPDERLARFRCVDSSLARSHELLPGRRASVFPPRSAGQTGAIRTVVMPVALARTFAEFNEATDILPNTISETLYEICCN